MSVRHLFASLSVDISVGNRLTNVSIKLMTEMSSLIVNEDMFITSGGLLNKVLDF